MRTRALAVLALLALSADVTALAAQRLPLPRIGRRTAPPASDPEPTAPAVARQLAMTRSHWSINGYSMISSMRAPAGSGAANTVAIGGGTSGEYRINDFFTTTADITASTNNGFTAIDETIEVGTRFRPMPHDPDVRPFLDVRGGFMHMYDLYSNAFGGGASAAPGPGTDAISSYRYSRGFGGVVGTGMEVALTNTMALSTGISAMRNRMTVYRVSSPEALPTGSGYWMTSYRFMVGLRYNWIHTLHLDQKQTH